MADTDLDPETVDAPPTGATPGPPAPVDIGGWPTWLRRSVIAGVLILAFGVAAWGASKARTGEADRNLDRTIVGLFPVEGAQALRQTEVGADLAQGFDGRLVINGIEIPEDQMEGAIDPNSVSVEELEKYGIRPNNRNRVYFKPGPGKVIEEFDSGTVAIALRYFRDGQESTTSQTVTWEIRVD